MRQMQGSAEPIVTRLDNVAREDSYGFEHGVLFSPTTWSRSDTKFAEVRDSAARAAMARKLEPK